MSGKRGKNDAADAAAICEAVTRPTMRFVPIKSIEQPSRLFVHRARQGYVQQRTALINRIRGLLSELGIVLPLKAATVHRDPYLRTRPLQHLPRPPHRHSLEHKPHDLWQNVTHWWFGAPSRCLKFG